MRRKSKFGGFCFVLVVALASIVCASAYASTITVICKVTDDFHIVTENGTVYEVADTDKGGDLLFHLDKKVSVTGVIPDDEDSKVIGVISDDENSKAIGVISDDEDSQVIEVISFRVLEE